jgi:hypothetical protein
MRGLLGASLVATHQMIYGELLIGDIGGGRKLFRAFQHIPYLKTISHSLVVALVTDRNLHGRGAGWIDMHLLASALSAHVPLWTADEPLRVLAEEFGIAYSAR